MATIGGGEMHCLLVVPAGADWTSLTDALRGTAEKAGVRLSSRSEQIVGADPSPIVSEVGRADLIVGVVGAAGTNQNIYYEIGLAHALGKPTVLLIEAGAPAAAARVEGVTTILFSRDLEGISVLRSRFSRLIADFRRYPRRFRPIRNAQIPLPLVELDRLADAEFENLCFELLAQLGFRRVQWNREIHEFDAVATLPKKDPDGFEYQELWLISMGLQPRSRRLLEMLSHSSEGLMARLAESFDGINRHLGGGRYDATLTVLFIFQVDDPQLEEYENNLRRAERRLRERGAPPSVRVRIWDRQRLSSLVQQHPQLSYKYFSEAGREPSRARKSAGELNQENVALNERLQAVLAALEEEKERRVRAERDIVWKELSFTAAHKLGNPLFAIETNVRVLDETLRSSNSTVKEIMSDLVASIEKSKAIIEQFKSLTKAQELAPRPADLRPIIEAACRVAEKAGIITRIRSPEKTPAAFVDPQRIGECFDELVANAMHWFDKNEKRIEIDIEVASRETLPPSLDHNRRYLRIRVEDNGSGVQPEIKERIFAPFFTKYVHGTGLGLAYVQRIIEGHGGSIVESGQAGVGARFEILLPTAPVGR